MIIAVGSIFLIEHAKENIESSMDAYESIEASENNETTNLDTSLDITDEEKNAIQLGCTTISNDLLEFLYRIKFNDFLYAKDYPLYTTSYSYSAIPAKLFEDTILPFFDISIDELRERALYDAENDIYPWQDISCGNVLYIIHHWFLRSQSTKKLMSIQLNSLSMWLAQTIKRTNCLFTRLSFVFWMTAAIIILEIKLYTKVILPFRHRNQEFQFKDFPWMIQ